ncbi:MAG: NAD(P)-binding domain-containing protein [bacterium]|nr:NAD(P)-binding domain-containing protein [bacterium]
MRITFIGIGQVGTALAVRLAEHGHEVLIGESRPGSTSVASALARSGRLRALPLEEAIRAAEVVFLAVPFRAVNDLLPSLAASLAGKVLVDCTNPVGPGLVHGLESAV